jgi:hypothetical protein
MHPEAPSATNPLPPDGLPPIKPPSGKFIAQLFLVPLLIALAVVGLFYTLQGVFGLGGPRTAEQFLRSLDQANADVRWRAAQDLAQVLPRDDKLAADTKFALDLAERLRQTLIDGAAGEKRFAELSAKSSTANEEEKKAIAKARDDLEASRKYADYLAASLGGFALPVGVPLLKEMALKETAQEPRALALRRRQAVWALANLGMNLKRFDTLAEAQQEAVLETLREESSGASERGKWAKAALDWMTDRRAGMERGLGDDFLTLADADDPWLREMTAHALNFWEGTPEEKGRIEDVLVRLSYDAGTGEDRLAWLADDAEEVTRSVTRKPGAEVRYNATVALARRGSSRVRLALLDEMLDEDGLKNTFRVTSKDGKESADEAKVWLTMTSALRAVAQLLHKNPRLDLSDLRRRIDALADHPNPSLRTEAKNAQNALKQNG